jgi:hypothetical protein
MSRPDHSREGGGLDQRVDALEAEATRLRDALDCLRASLAVEVRTRRLVVVDESGFERLVAEGAGNHGFLVLRGQAVGQGSTSVQLFADDPLDGEGVHVGVALGERGDIVAVLEVSDGREPTLWLRGPDDTPAR